MSEQLTQNEVITNGEFGNYVSLSIGSSTINQLKKAKKLPSKDYGDYGNLKPDGLLIDERNKKDISVICVIEFKKPSEFNTKEKKEIATKQCNTYCQLVNAKFGVISDGQTYIWINPKSKKPEIQYFDNDVFQNKSKVERGYSYILREDGYELGAHYILNKSQETETKETIKLIDKILSHINESNSQFIQEEYKNPSNLARSVWQDVWISKSASPEKSLSTFIEVFMFKFLSDLEVLTEDQNGNKVSFTEVISKGQDKCLKYYFSNVREYIKELFPSNQNDQTTLINGISLSPSVVEDNQVFYRILKKFDEFGDLKNIDPEFKSRLFEDFLKKSISKKNWGQFFTPRNVVKAIVEMSEIDKLPDGSNVYDPACGVGGFLLEPLITKRPTDYYFDNNKLKSKINYSGSEKGFELEDKLTIILAKSNFVIYLSELLKSNPTLTSEFADAYNKLFNIYTNSILGSLSKVESDKYDLIMSNPPYVTRGVRNYKDAINENTQLSKNYSINAMGLEGLFLEKICRELKIGGKALIVLPEGVFYRENDAKIREYILNNFTIEAIVSLPKNTFYTTPQKTYILSIVKKQVTGIQTEPVFTYFAIDIGETKDKRRLPIKENDLKDMVRQFKYFLTDKIEYTPISKKCRILPISDFQSNSHWLIDKWLSDEEQKEIGIEQESVEVKNINEFKDDLTNVIEIIQSKDSELSSFQNSLEQVEFKTLLFEDVFDIDDGYPFKSSIYTSNTNDIKLIRIQDVNNKSEVKEVRIPKNFNFHTDQKINKEKKELYWVKKGDFLISLSGAGGFNISKYNGEEGYLNQRIVKVRLRESYKDIILNQFIPVIFKNIKIELNKEGFGANNNLSKNTLKLIEIKIPVNTDGEFDLAKQEELAKNNSLLVELKNKLKNSLSIISNTEIDF